MDNLYCATLSAESDVVPLDDELRRHVAAFRLRDGELVRVLNGKGLVATCRCDRSPQGSVLTVVGTTYAASVAPRITVALGVLDHRERFELAVEKLTELGVHRIIPVICDRSKHMRSTHDRLVAKAAAALTQSGNPYLPEITVPMSIEELPHDAELVLVGDAEGANPLEDVAAVQGASEILVVVGPEGGFTDRELMLLRSRQATRTWRLGALRLRAETAAIALTAVLRGIMR